MSSDESEPFRYLLTGQLVTASPLAIHSGQSYDEGTESPFRENPFATQVKCDQLVLRDHQDRPYIPGSSLKGVLRHFMVRQGRDELMELIFGTDSIANADSQGGCVIFEDLFLDDGKLWLNPESNDLANSYTDWIEDLTHNPACERQHPRIANDCPPTDSFANNSWRQGLRHSPLFDTRHLPFWAPAQLTYVEQHVGINRRTGTANERMLYDSEVVPAGIPFHLRIQIDDPFDFQLGEAGEQKRTEILHELLQLLTAFNLDPACLPPQLGACNNLGWGLMDWNINRTQVFRQLGSDPVNPVLDEKLQGEALQEVQTSRFDSKPLTKQPTLQLGISLEMYGQFLVNDPSNSIGSDSSALAQNDYAKMDHFPRMDAGEGDRGNGDPRPLTGLALLPGSSIKGTLRSQLEKIVRTLGLSKNVSPHRQPDEISGDANITDIYLQQLFGREDLASKFWVSSFVGRDQKRVEKQELVAIDRWTGSVSGSAKFDIGYFESPKLDGVLRFALPTDPQQFNKTVGLISLFLQDLFRERIKFGYGSSKGFGDCHVTLNHFSFAGEQLCPDNESMKALLEELASKPDSHDNSLFQDKDAVSKINQWVNAALVELRQGA